MPLHAIKLLADANHEVHLFTNPPTEDRPDLPDILPSNINIHFVTDGRKRTIVKGGVGGKGKGFRPVALFKQINQIKEIVRKEKLELFHAYGYGRTASFSSLLKFSGLKAPAFVTLFGLPQLSAKERLIRKTWKRLHLISCTSYVQELLQQSKLPATLIRTGPVRNMFTELKEDSVTRKDRVLFWRDPTAANGADICLKAFQQLAPEYPSVTFEFAIRPHWNEIDGIETLEQTFENVKVHRFPYKDGITIADLVTSSKVIVLPFRKHSIHPQLAIAESLACGIPTITTDLCSAREIVREGENGFLTPVDDVTATVQKIKEVLDSDELFNKLSRQATQSIKEQWGWSDYVNEVDTLYQRVIQK